MQLRSIKVLLLLLLLFACVDSKPELQVQGACVKKESCFLNESPRTYRDAKRILAHLIDSKGMTFYAGCAFKRVEKKLKALGTCDQNEKNKPNVVPVINWEHIVPASVFGRSMACWKRGGRRACRQKDQAFNQMESDLHNLAPSLMYLNQKRSSLSFGDPFKGKQNVPAGTIMQEAGEAIFVPPFRARGAIARTYLYFQDRYHLPLSERETELFQTWQEKHPPSPDQCLRHIKIVAVQGNSNPYVQKACGGLQVQ